MADLKPCPACGSTKLTHVRRTRHKLGYVMCQDCTLYGPTEQGDDVSRWNSLPRHTDTEADQVLKREVYGVLVKHAYEVIPYVRISPLVHELEAAGWHIEPDETNKENG